MSSNHPMETAAGIDRIARMAPTRRWQLNAPLAMRTIVLVVLFLGAIHLWHGYLVRNNATALLHRAAKQETDDDWEGAAQSLTRYLALRPGDASARVRLAKDFDRVAASTADQLKSLGLFASALAAAPHDLDARRRHLALTFELQNHGAVLEHADLLLELAPGDATALKYQALALYARWEIKEEKPLTKVREAFEAANQANPADLTIATRLARLYRVEMNEPRAAELADSVINKLIEANGRDIAALVARHAYRKEFGLAGADADLDLALAIDRNRPPDKAAEAGHDRDPALLLAAGLRARQKGEASAIDYFEQAIAAAPDKVRGYLLLAETHRQQGDPRAALGILLKGLEKIGPANLRLQVEAASIEIELGELEGAEQSLAALERQTGQLFGRQQTEWLAMIAALRADLLLQRRDYVAAIPVLKQILSLRQGGATHDQKAAADAEVLMHLGVCYAMLGLDDQAAVAHQAAADLQPRRQPIRLAAAHAWDNAGWLDEAIRQYEEALAIESPPAPVWLAVASAYFRQQLKLSPAKRDWTAFQQVIARARAALSENVSLDLLQAEYESARGHAELAAEMFQAIEPKVADVPDLSVRVAQGYQRLGRSEDSDRIAARLMEGPAPEFGALLQCELLLNRGRGDEAEKALASAAARLPSDDRHALQYRRAMVLLQRGQPVEARDLLELLSADGSDDPRPLQALTELALEGHDFNQARRHEERLRLLERIEGQTGWRFYRAQRLIGEALRAGDADDRQKRLEEARSLQSRLERLRPYWAPTHLLKARLAQLNATPDDESAILAYYTALRLGERRMQVYQELVSLLFRQHRVAEAAGLIDRMPDAAGQRLRAVARLLRGGSASREQAFELLQSLVESGDEAPLDRLLLARLYEGRNQMDKAREQLDTLVQREKPDPAHLAAYIEHLLRSSDETPHSERLLGELLDQLADLEPENKSFRTLSLRARWLKLEHRESEIGPLVAGFLDQPETDSDRSRFTQRLLLVAGLYEKLALESDAETYYRQAAESSAQAYRPLVMWLARHQRAAEAIELCRGAAERDDSSAAAVTVAAVLTLAAASADEHRSAEPILADALASHPDDAGLLLALATLRIMQHNDDAAVRQLRRVLRIEPRNVVAMNNLAALLAGQSPSEKEALTLVDRAIGIAGAQAELLDTKGWILLEQKRLAEAEASFLEALARSPDSPRYRFHLALAYQRQGKQSDARQMLDRAIDRQLASELLTPREREELTKLESRVR
jgi:tetratricopeptide (TPR) repeat protein